MVADIFLEWQMTDNKSTVLKSGGLVGNRQLEFFGFKIGRLRTDLNLKSFYAAWKTLADLNLTFWTSVICTGPPFDEHRFLQGGLS